GSATGEGRRGLPEEGFPGPALAVGPRIEQVEVDMEVAVTTAPGSSVLRNEVSKPGRAVIDPLVDGIERRCVSAQEELRRRFSVTEHIVGGAESRHQVLLVERTVLGGERRGDGHEEVRSNSLIAEMVAQMFEAQTALQREPVDRPSVLRIQREQTLHLFLV